ncbi:MAG: efflux RND transporter permease subunit, partial [Endomicrobiia bacterium]
MLLKLPVERPTAVTMFFLGIFLFGIISLQRLPQELFPSLDYPQITVVTKYEGAGPEEAEKLISKIIEETVGTAKNIRRVVSISKEGTSIVICEFYWGTDINFAALEIREKIDLIKERLPKDAHEPVVMKYNPFQLEAMNLSVSYKTSQDNPWKMAELRRLCKKHIKDELERLEGVAKVELYGGTDTEILVEVDKGRLLANQMSLLDIIRTLRETNITYPAGIIKEEEKEYTVKTIGEFKTIQQIKELIIPVERREEYDKYKIYRRKKEKIERNVVYLSDIAEVKESIKDIKGYSRYNNNNHISVSIYPQSKTNLIKLSKVVRKKLQEIIKTKLPAEVEIKIVYDQAEFIKSALANIYFSAIQGGILAFAILFLFLKDFVASAIIIISIPLAILATISLMYFSGISINTMSLGGLALGVGMLVDNSIVVLEKIFAEKIKNPELEKKLIIYNSVTHVTAEIISSTLTTIAIFLPLVFVGGVVGQLFKELALTVSFSLISSILVALFLVPRLALWLNLEKYSKIISQEPKDKISNLLTKFPPLLKKVLSFPIKKIYAVLWIYIFLGLVIFYFIPKEFMPKLDERKFILNINLPPGTILEKTNKIVSEIENFILSLKETKDVIVNIGSTGEEKPTEIETLGSHQARIICRLKPKGRKTTKIVSLIDKKIKSLPLALNIETEFITQQGLFGSGIGSAGGIVIEIKGKQIDKLKKYAEEISEYLKGLKEIYGVKIIPQESTPELKLEIYRDRASLFGLSVQDISATILAGIKGYVSTKFKQQEDELDIRVRLSKKDTTEVSDITDLTIYSFLLNRHIRLAQLCELQVVKSPPEIRRTEGQRMYLVLANAKKGFTKVIKVINNFIAKTKQEEIDIDITGEALALRESISSSFFALILAIIVIYMILASQFESLIQP